MQGKKKEGLEAIFALVREKQMGTLKMKIFPGCQLVCGARWTPHPPQARKGAVVSEAASPAGLSLPEAPSCM